MEHGQGKQRHARWYRRFRFVLWGARGYDVQIGGFVDESFAEFARLG